MNSLRFYEHFACAFGTLCLAVLGLSMLIQENLQGGPGALIVMLLVSLVYAFTRKPREEYVEDAEPYDFSSRRYEVDSIGRRSE